MNFFQARDAHVSSYRNDLFVLASIDGQFVHVADFRDDSSYRAMPTIAPRLSLLCDFSRAKRLWVPCDPDQRFWLRSMRAFQEYLDLWLPGYRDITRRHVRQGGSPVSYEIENWNIFDHLCGEILAWPDVRTAVKAISGYSRSRKTQERKKKGND